jgi:hypothetical protein
MASVHTNESEEEANVQYEKLDDKVKKEHIFVGVLGVAVVAILVYTAVKNINNKNKRYK